MLWIEEMLGHKKPIIAMLHLQPLPGDPAYKHGDKMENVVAKARKDLHALQKGGVNAIMFSNEFSLPYQRKMSFITPAAMARVIGELKNEITVPYGVDCISDGMASIELAAAVDASFIRGTFHGVYVGDGGFYNNDFSEIIRRKVALHLDDLKMLYFLNPESDVNLDPRPLDEKAKSLIFKANPDGLCISASAAGQDVEDALIRSVKAVAPEVVVLCNTGLRVNTVPQKLSECDAGVVGTTFKYDGDLYNAVDETRVSDFMAAVREYRKTLD
ncbi:membrane complex biogenesis BtpA family protein [Lachnospiraceae bacterium PF1-21]|uniref:BtpA/SgcQ family protein n=1 Tax=Ohessyouella blattaphilus TaxID=2949333 RepID=UPI00256967E2|nr:BtpA/SgcQ family protein [Lachnospiraceae bacterium OttesenSCG-928-J05]